MEEEKYIKKFNEGYLLARYDPELAKSVFKALEGKEDIEAVALLDGGKELAKEMKGKDRFLEMHQNYKVSDKGISNDKTKDKSKGKEDLERE